MLVKSKLFQRMEDINFEDTFFPLTVGEEVPEGIEFEVFQDEEIKKTSFSELRGKWLVLFFYPGDFTFVCPTELGEMAGLYEQFQKEGAEVVSVSTDSVYVHKAWHDESETIKQVNYPMAADPAHVLSDVFGVLMPDQGMALRGTFIISPDGVIKAAEINDASVGRNAKETLRKFKAAKYVSENPGNVCPASWDEGEATLEPGLDLVGKI